MYIPQGKYFYFPPNYLYFKSKGKRFHQNFNKVYPQNKPIKLRPNYSITKWRSKLNPKLRYKQMMREYWEKRVPKKSYYYPNINTHKEDQRMYPTKATKYQIKHYGIENALNVINNQPIRRLFDKPLIASPQAAMSSECVACDKSGMDCMLVRIPFLTSLYGKGSTTPPPQRYRVTNYVIITIFFFVLTV